MINYTKPIAESKNFIVLDKYTPEWKLGESYQSEFDLESELIADLQNQGYEYLPKLNTREKMLANIRLQLQTLNNVLFTEEEWNRLVVDYLDKPGDTIIDKTRKIHDDYIKDFVFDDGHIQNIYLVDKKNIPRNRVQVIRQFEQTGIHANRYDVTLLVNGLPLVQIELKKGEWPFAKPSIRFTDTAKRASTANIPSINTCSSLLFPTVPIVAILPTPPSGIKTVSILL